MATFSIASWNVNSIKARRAHILRWLDAHAPDVLMLQELKGLDFPADAFEPLGYQSHAVTQKAYNGVAILSKQPMEMIRDRLPGDNTDEQARYLEVEIDGLRLINIYAPNGNPVETEKFPYKLDWMDRLIARAKTLRADNIPFLIGGDFNVIPEDRDCYDPQKWANDALRRPETLSKFRALQYLGLTDAFRIHNQSAGAYTFWDYQAGAWQRDNGLRIDHFLLSPAVTDRMICCTIDKTPRGEEKASDHTPIVLEISK